MREVTFTLPLAGLPRALLLGFLSVSFFGIMPAEIGGLSRLPDFSLFGVESLSNGARFHLLGGRLSQSKIVLASTRSISQY